MSNNLLRIIVVLMLFKSHQVTALAQPATEAKSTASSTELSPRRLDAQLDAIEEWDEKNSFPNNAILFIGDSSIRDWLTRRVFPTFPVINRGLKGATIADINYFDEGLIGQYKPSVIVFHAGENDIAAGKSSADVVVQFQVFTGYVSTRLPKARVIFLPLMPSPASWQHWPQMQEVNSRIKELTEKNQKLVYVDTATPLLGKNNRPNTEFFIPNGQHINYKGWEIWSKLLIPVLKKELEDQ